MRVFVAMSGGVDSSLAAALLAEAGHDVVGVTLQLLPEGDEPGSCCGTDAVRSARRVCDVIGIPHYVWNAREAFDEMVVEPYRAAYAAGRTPNPCGVCNARVKFGWMLERALIHGADALATGHYARILTDADGAPWLARGADPSKDQSYFLSDLGEDRLRHILFPLGDLAKSEVRDLAASRNLPSASRPESQDACFVLPGESAAFVGAAHPEALLPGDVIDLAGNVLGRHAGIARYTIGQRKGIGIGGAGEPLYVVRIDAGSNSITVGPAEELLSRRVTATNLMSRVADGARVTAAIRYRMPVRPASVRVTESNLIVEFDDPVSGVAPGQTVVCYQGDRVVAGGEILCAE